MRMMWFGLAIAIALAGGSALAATTIWLSTSETGAPIGGDTIAVAPNTNVQLYCFMNTDAPGNTFEMMVGYDRSNAASYGAGVPGDAATGKLTLVSDKAAIKTSIAPAFSVMIGEGCT